MNIGILTGKRGGFDAMLPLIKRLEKAEWANLFIIVCDQHMMKMFGDTHQYVKGQLHPETKITYITAIAGNTCTIRSYNCSKVMKEITEICTLLDTLILYGDRGESLAAAQAALINGVKIIHLEAGEVTGTIDDPTRMAITCMADYAFAPHEDAERRVEKITHTTVSGDLHLDAYKDIATTEEAELWIQSYYPKPIVSKQTAIFLMHPVIEDYGDHTRLDTGDFAHRVLQELVDYNYHIIAIYPCSDPGNEYIIDTLHEFEKRGEAMVFQNIPGRIFRRLLTDADLMVGNSSAGIKEAPFVETISIDIGTRQEGRARDCGVFHVRTHKNLGSTLNWIKNHTVDRAVLGERHFPYGKGNATNAVFSGIECIVRGEI